MKLSKIFSIITIAIMLLMSGANTVLAATIGGVSIEPSAPDQAGQQIASVGNKIIGIIQTVGTIAAVIVLLILGIKYMMGSAEEKAEYKKTMIPYIVGAVIVLAAVNIVDWIITGFGGIFD